MIHPFRYDHPQDVFHADVLQKITTQARILVITANRQHADWLRRQLRQHQHSTLQVVTLQAYLLRTALQHTPRRVLSAATRSLIVAQAWQSVSGPLYQRYHGHRGALQEISNVMSWISQRRTQWRRPDNALTFQHELGRVYAAYCDLLDQYQFVGYDDVALHVLDHVAPSQSYDAVYIYELQHAQPAQLRAIQHVLASTPHVEVAAWAPTAPFASELADVVTWMEQFGQIATLPSTAPQPQRHLVQRLQGQSAPHSTVTLIANDVTAHPKHIGCMTSLDECHTVAQIAIARLQAQRQVDIICADEAQVVPLRTIFAQYGIDLPMIAPPTHQNPLIQLVRQVLRWSNTTDDGTGTAQSEVLCAIAQLPFIGMAQHTARVIGDNPQHPTAQRIQAWIERFYAAETLPQAIKQILDDSGALQWCWQHAQIPVDVRDHWFRDLRKWMYQINELINVMQLTAPITTQDWSQVLALEVLPTQLHHLQQSTLPLRIHGRQGQPAADDVVIIMGLSEHTGPYPMRELQLIDDATLQSLWQTAVSLPQWQHRPAWREREARTMARMLGTHAQEVILSFAYFDTSGKAQLPSGYFEHILGERMTLTRDGTLTISAPDIPCLPVASIPVAQLRRTPTQSTVPLLYDHQFSASQIRRYLTCPKQYYYEYVLKLNAMEDEESDTRALDLGSMIHELCCAIIGNGNTSNVSLLNEDINHVRQRMAQLTTRAASALNAAWHGETVHLPGGGTYTPSTVWSQAFGVGLRQQSSLQRAQRIIERWVAHEAILQQQASRRPILLEQRVTFMLAGQRIMAQIDRIDMVTDAQGTRYEIIDYKVSKSKSHGDLTKEFIADSITDLKNVQIPMYLLACQSSDWTLTPAIHQMHLWYLGDDKENLVVPRSFVVHDGTTAPIKQGRKHVGYHIDRSYLTYTFPALLDSIMQQMRHTPYPTRPHLFTCQYCAFTTICDDAEV